MSAFLVVTIDTDGTTSRQVWDLSEDSTLAHLQKAVGGHVDVVALSPWLDMWVNDEGILLGLPVNPVATRVAATYGPRIPYFGPVVLTGGPDPEGATLPLTDEHAAHLVALGLAARP